MKRVYTWEELAESQDFNHGDEFVPADELRRAEALIEHIEAMCGTPDAAEGCRNILKRIEQWRKNE